MACNNLEEAGGGGQEGRAHHEVSSLGRSAAGAERPGYLLGRRIQELGRIRRARRQTRCGQCPSRGFGREGQPIRGGPRQNPHRARLKDHAGWGTEVRATRPWAERRRFARGLRSPVVPPALRNASSTCGRCSDRSWLLLDVSNSQWLWPTPAFVWFRRARSRLQNLAFPTPRLESAFGIIEIGPAESIEVANDRFEATILVLSQTGFVKGCPIPALRG